MIHETEPTGDTMVEAVRKWSYEALVAEGLDPDCYEVVDGALIEDLGMSGSGGFVATAVPGLRISLEALFGILDP